MRGVGLIHSQSIRLSEIANHIAGDAMLPGASCGCGLASRWIDNRDLCHHHRRATFLG
jgi:hypothetical protein